MGPGPTLHLHRPEEKENHENTVEKAQRQEIRRRARFDQLLSRDIYYVARIAFDAPPSCRRSLASCSESLVLLRSLSWDSARYLPFGRAPRRFCR